MWMGADSDEEASGDEYDGSRDEGRDLSDDRAFWRRRFFILCAGVVALGVCAWMFPGAHQPSPRTAAATRASVAALARRQALPPAAYGSAWPGPKSIGGPTAKASSAPPTASAKLANAGDKAKQVSTAYHPRPVASASGGAHGGCVPADIVLSLFTSESSHPRGAQPKFSVYAVSTSAAACTLPYGAGSVQVIVTRHGHVVWDSAACKAAAATPVRFALGVPQELTMTWNPKAATPAGCAGSLPAGAAGTLDAVAMSDGQSSPVHTFEVGSLAAECGLERVPHVLHLDDLHGGTGA
ncbi:MAG: hypothetical protein ACRDP7_14530 [Trebonia sp.]